MYWDRLKFHPNDEHGYKGDYWNILIGDLDIDVFELRKGVWVMNCEELNFREEDLASTNLLEAQETAIYLCKQTVKDMAAALNRY